MGPCPHGYKHTFVCTHMTSCLARHVFIICIYSFVCIYLVMCTLSLHVVLQWRIYISSMVPCFRLPEIMRNVPKRQGVLQPGAAERSLFFASSGVEDITPNSCRSAPCLISGEGQSHFSQRKSDSVRKAQKTDIITTCVGIIILSLDLPFKRTI